jgi:hypothetical protein
MPLLIGQVTGMTRSDVGHQNRWFPVERPPETAAVWNSVNITALHRTDYLLNADG